MRPRVRIVGVGNLLRSDDGVGVRVVEELMRRGVPSEVELVDAGTAGLDVCYALDEVENLIVIDAADIGDRPGAIRWFSAEQVSQSWDSCRVSLHKVSVADVLALAEQLNQVVHIYVCGIQPGSVEYSLELTPAVAASIPHAADMIEEKVAEMLET